MRWLFIIPVLNIVGLVPAFAESAEEHCTTSIGLIGINGCNRLLDREPENARIYVNRGRKWLVRGAHFSGRRSEDEMERAQADFKKAIALDPGLAAAYLGLGDTLKLLGDKAGALAAYTRAMELDPSIGPFRHLAMGELDLPLSFYSSLIDREPRNGFAYSGRAIAWGAKGDYERAFADHARAIELDVRSSRLRGNRAYTFHGKGSYENAIADYTAAIALDLADAAYLTGRARCYLMVGKLEEALRDADASRSLLPYDAQGLLVRGETLSALGRNKEAIRALRMALARSYETKEPREALRRLGFYSH
jgi:tetratricopeptide (TPR) repeat protein